MPPSFCICFSWSERSSRSNDPFFIFSAIFVAFSTSIVCAAFSTRLTTSPMPRMREAMRPGWKSSSASHFSPTPISLIGLPVTARIESAAPPRPSPSARVKHDAGDADAAVEGFGGVDGVLAGQRVGDEQDFVRMNRGFDVADFVHQLFVDGDAAGGVVDDDVVAAELAGIFGAARDLQRRLSGDDRKRCDARLLAEHAELLLRGGTARVERRHQHFLAIAVRQAIGDLGGRRRFARALQADHQDADRRGGVEIDRLGVGAEHRDELVVDDLDDHLAGRDRAQHFGADGLGFDLLGEVLDDIERDVGFEQGATNLAHRLDDVAFGQRAASCQLVEDAGKALCQRLKHLTVRLPASRR